MAILGLAAIAVISGGAGCTKVVEQPPAPLAVEAPVAVDPAQLAAKAARSKHAARGSWSALPQKQAEEPRGRVATSSAAEPTAVAGTQGVPREQLQKILDTALPTLTSCWGNAAALSTSIAFEVTGAGKAENVRMPGAPKDAERCVIDRVSALALPTYAGPALTIQIPVTVTPGTPAGKSPSVAPAATGSAGAGTASAGTARSAGASPLFVNP